MNTKKKVDYPKWSLIIGTVIAIPGVIATLVKFPEFPCKIGLNTAACVVPQKDVELITQAETGEPLSGVKIQVIAKGAPEIQYTDINGYAKIQIQNKGDVKVSLIKEGYPVQDFNINLGNDQNTDRIIRLSKSGQPDVQPVAVLPPSPSPSSSSSPSPTPSPSLVATTSSSNPVKTDSDVTWELKQCVRKQTDVSCSFVLTTVNERRQYDFWLDKQTKMTDRRGHEYFSSKGTFVDDKAGAGSNIAHEMQKGSIYDVSVDFTKIPTSVSEVNSLIVGNKVKFDDVSIK